VLLALSDALPGAVMAEGAELSFAEQAARATSAAVPKSSRAGEDMSLSPVKMVALSHHGGRTRRGFATQADARSRQPDRGL
jgi:hypothetical protein